MSVARMNGESEDFIVLVCRVTGHVSDNWCHAARENRDVRLTRRMNGRGDMLDEGFCVFYGTGTEYHSHLAVQSNSTACTHE